MNLETLKKLFTELRDFLEFYNDNSISYYRRIVRNVVVMLESDEVDSVKMEYVIKSYKSLYRSGPGFADYCIWDNDYAKRKQLNEPLDRITDELWKIMKPYV